jgi:alpha 1,6-mannosyltransferase
MSPPQAGFSERLRSLQASWSAKHPGFIHEIVSDKAAVHLISYLYASIPEIVEAYKALPEAVLKADFFRYLILLARGGIYSDIDTAALKPAIEWLPDDFDQATVGLIIGIEADVGDRVDWNLWYSRRIQFCQWTIQAKPGHPVLRDVVATITEDTLRMKRDRLLKPGDLPKSIVEFTGPAMWTDAIFSYFNNPTFFDFSTRTSNVSYADFSSITEHKKIGDVIVLPITSFSPGVKQMGAEEVEHRMAFVRHDFDGK